jgi:hypothetical protein
MRQRLKFLVAAIFVGFAGAGVAQDSAGADAVSAKGLIGELTVEGESANVPEPSEEGENGENSRLSGTAKTEDKAGGATKPAESKKPIKVEIADFVSFIYTPGPRDPFISPLASGTVVIEDQSTEDISVESLMAFAEKLKDDLGNRIRVVGISVPPGGGDNRALVIYAEGRGEGGNAVVPALPPRTVTVESGIPVRYPPDETAFISRLAQLVAQNSPIRLKRDSRTEAVIFPISKIDDRGVQVMLPGYDEPILLPVYRDVETFSGAGE